MPSTCRPEPFKGPRTSAARCRGVAQVDWRAVRSRASLACATPERLPTPKPVARDVDALFADLDPGPRRVSSGFRSDAEMEEAPSVRSDLRPAAIRGTLS